MRHSGSRIIIVDDEQGIRDLLQDNLEAEGYICYATSSGDEALKVLAEQPVELAIVDIMMLGMTGLSLFDYIKEIYPDVAIVFLTAVNDANLGALVLKNGASDYIVKPVTRKRLLQAVQDALERREAALQEGRQNRGVESEDVMALERSVDVRAISVLAQNAPVGIFLVQEGKFWLVNSHFQQEMGYTQGELNGMDSLGLVLPEDREAVREAGTQMLRGVRSEPYEFRILRKDGQVRQALARVIPVQYGGKNAALGFYTDITEQKRSSQLLADSTELYRAVVDNISEAIAISRGNKRLFVNRAFLDLFKLSSMEEALVTSRDQFLLPEDRERLGQHDQARQRGEPVPDVNEYRVHRTDGEVRTISVWVRDILYQGELAHLGVARDVTEQKQAEGALVDRMRELDGLNRFARERINELLEVQETLEARTRSLGALLRVARTNFGSVEPETAVETVLEAAVKYLGMEAGEAWAVDEERQLLVQVGHVGLFPTEFRQVASLRLGEGLPGAAAVSGEPVVTEGLEQDPRCARLALQSSGLRLFVCVPVRDGRRVVSVMCLASTKPRPWKDEETEFLEGVGHILGRRTMALLLHGHRR
jgi:PAS domain S-box-containing protein